MTGGMTVLTTPSEAVEDARTSGRRCRLPRSVSSRRMADLRQMSRGLHALQRLVRTRQPRGVLPPVRHGRLVTPIDELRHRLHVKPRVTVSTHAGFIVPQGDRPESTTRILSHRSALETRRALHLPHALPCVPSEGRQETGGAEPQPGQRYERHVPHGQPASHNVRAVAEPPPCAAGTRPLVLFRQPSDAASVLGSLIPQPAHGRSSRPHTDQGTADRRCIRVQTATPAPPGYSAVVGSITVRISETRSAGKPPCFACSRTIASFGAR